MLSFELKTESLKLSGKGDLTTELGITNSKSQVLDVEFTPTPKV